MAVENPRPKGNEQSVNSVRIDVDVESLQERWRSKSAELNEVSKRRFYFGWNEVSNWTPQGFLRSSDPKISETY